MTDIEMRNFEAFDPDDADRSAQERLLYNNNVHHSHPHHPHHQHLSQQPPGSGSPMLHHHPNGLDENHYQIPYAHLHQNHQHAYLQHLQQQQQQQTQQPQQQYHHLQQQTPSLTYHQGGLYNSNGDLLNSLHHPHTNNSLANGNGSTSGYSTTGYRDKYSLAYPVREDNSWRQNRSQHGGSGKVYRSRRKAWWMAMIIILLLIILVGGVLIAIYFTVLKKDQHTQTEFTSNGDSDSYSGDTNSDRNNNDGGPFGYNNATNDPDDVIGIGGLPPDTSQKPIYSIPSASPGNNNNNNDNNNNRKDENFYPDFVNVKLQKFDAYWHPGDSRLFTATLTNGTVIQAFGPKKGDGTAKSIYSFSITDVDAVTKSVRFLGQQNLASVILPSGVIVHYGWTSNFEGLEVKIFEPLDGHHGEGPISHLAEVEVTVSKYFLSQIHKTIAESKNKRRLLVGNRPTSTKCFSRFPIKVTKCGGKYSYDGAFVTGVITGIEKPITMSALPWPKEPDPCYKSPSNGDSTENSNYYLPLPGHVDNDNATMIKDAFAASSAGLFTDLCNVMSIEVYRERHEMCSDIATKVNKFLRRKSILNLVYDSCSTFLNTLHLACTAIKGISAQDNMSTLSEHGLLRSLSRRLSDSFPPTLPKQVDLKVHAFCPSSPPISSYESTVSIQSIRGNVVQDDIHVNCPDHPEVAMVDLYHLLTTSEVMSSESSFDIVKHQMRICSICAFEKEISAQVVSDEMLCNNTCTRTNVFEQIPKYYKREERTFVDQDSVYCHEFLTNVDNRIEPIGKRCLGNCMSHLHVRFKIEDTGSNVVYYDQTVQCSEHQKHSCKMNFGH